MTDTLWAVQKSFAGKDGERLTQVCEALRVPTVEFFSRPFSKDVPDVPTAGAVVFYGSARVCGIVESLGLWHPGVFGKLNDFAFDKQKQGWGEALLNHEAIVVKVSDVAGLSLKGDMFCRPVDDAKSFTGDVFAVDRLVGIAEALKASGREDEQLVIAPVQSLVAEWRMFVVAGEVVTGSQYRSGNEGWFDGNVPASVKVFAEQQASTWAPTDVFVMDVAMTEKGLRVVEANGLNGCGFYSADVGVIVESVNAYVEATA